MKIAGDLLGERARLTPDAVALVTHPDGRRFTYRELDARAEARAREFVEVHQLAKGDRVGILAGNCVEFLECFFACGKVGTVLVPIGTRSTAAEIAHVVNDSGMTVLLVEDEYVQRAQAVRDAARARHVVPLRPIDELHGIGALATFPTTRRPTNVSASDDGVGAVVGARHAVPAPPSPRPVLDPEDLWTLLYTSGTTGTPKGVMIPHRQIVWNAYNTVIGWQLRSDDVTAIFTPLYHAGGLAAFLTPIVAIGGTVVLMRDFDEAAVWETVAKERVTVMLGVPTIYQRLADAPAFATADLSSIRWLICGGAPLPGYLIDRYQARGVTFKQGYGMTEVGVNCFAMTAEESVAKAGSIGKPLPFTEVRLTTVDLEGHRQVIANGEVGELEIRGPHVCRGYWNRPEATAQALQADGWFRTGDLARRDADGFYTVAGRAKDMFISGGVNVYPAEIEGVLVQHRDVHEAAVVAIDDATWGESGVAFLVTDVQRRPPVDELRAFLERSLARYKIPRRFEFVDALPKTASGKVIKHQLKENLS
jgi:fatty-acyl-CoA synthase